MGIQRIKEATKEVGLKEPVFDTNGFFKTIFYRPEQAAKHDVLIGSQKSSQKIIAAITANQSVTIGELATLLDISDTAVKKHLAKLKTEGLLRRIGPDKGGYWEVIK
jgi:ATP-dependent DNA helicase RecG